MRLTILLALLINTSLVYSQSIKVMTYNIRLDTPADGINQWPQRMDRVAGLIRKYDPDVVGVQEALHHQLQDLIRLLPEYSYCGTGRDDGKEKGEYSAILIRNSRFGVLEQTTSWLSETPDVPGSKSWDAAITRVMTRARVFDKDSRKELVLINTHFDHIGTEARKNSATLILNAVKGFYETTRTPTLVMGDFNCERTEEPYTVLTQDPAVLYDSRPPGDSSGTYCGFEVGAMECKAIDYIFHTREWVVRDFRVVKDHHEKYYPSDHLPVIAAFDLTQ
jgi:endonuclease/exonuclease/phosphatase family metal-dependent hydrolase